MHFVQNFREMFLVATLSLTGGQRPAHDLIYVDLDAKTGVIVRFISVVVLAVRDLQATRTPCATRRRTRRLRRDSR